MIIAKTIPGRPEPDPISVHIFLFKSIKSIICALSIICLSFEITSVFLLIRLIVLFFFIIICLNSSSLEMFHVKHSEVLNRNNLKYSNQSSYMLNRLSFDMRQQNIYGSWCNSVNSKRLTECFRPNLLKFINNFIR